ncbi:MAG: hypothetical protein Rhirs2KO_31740 [Rhizobiaceae bacterium]
MMNGWLALDRLAASRGDGLSPAFRDLYKRRAPTSGDNVVDLDATRGKSLIQVGALPQKEIRGDLPKNVVRLTRT